MKLFTLIIQINVLLYTVREGNHLRYKFYGLILTMVLVLALLRIDPNDTLKKDFQIDTYNIFPLVKIISPSTFSLNLTRNTHMNILSKSRKGIISKMLT